MPPGKVSKDNPPDPCPGAVTLELNTRGQLVSWKTTSSNVLPGSGPAEPPWKKLISAAGLDPARFQEIAPTFAPTLRFEHLSAWKGPRGDNGLTTQVDAASSGGKPVYFGFSSPTSGAGIPPRGLAGLRIMLSMLFIVVVAAALLAGRNLRAGQVDRRAAFRLSAAEFSFCLATWFFYCSHRASILEVTLFVYAAGWSLVTAALVWLLYVVLDPFVRRRWPTRLFP